MGLLQSIIKIVQSLIKLGKTFLPYSRKKGFESPSKHLIEVNSLNITLNLVAEEYFPFREASTFCINALSYHTPTIIKQLSEMINKRISDLSCNKEEFDKIKSMYETALKESGYFSSMSSNNNNTQNSRRNRNKSYMIQPTI